MRSLFISLSLFLIGTKQCSSTDLCNSRLANAALIILDGDRLVCQRDKHRESDLNNQVHGVIHMMPDLQTVIITKTVFEANQTMVVYGSSIPIDQCPSNEIVSKNPMRRVLKHEISTIASDCNYLGEVVIRNNLIYLFTHRCNQTLHFVSSSMGMDNPNYYITTIDDASLKEFNEIKSIQFDPVEDELYFSNEFMLYKIPFDQIFENVHPDAVVWHETRNIQISPNAIVSFTKENGVSIIAQLSNIMDQCIIASAPVKVLLDTRSFAEFPAVYDDNLDRLVLSLKVILFLFALYLLVTTIKHSHEVSLVIKRNLRKP